MKPMWKWCPVLCMILLAEGLCGCGAAKVAVQKAVVPKTVVSDAGSGQNDAGSGQTGAESGQIFAEAPDMEGAETDGNTAPDGTGETEDGAERSPAAETAGEEEFVRMIMVNSGLYVYSGEFADDELRCGMMDGAISSEVPGDRIPTQNDQSNFGTGYGYQYGGENEIQVFMPCDDSGMMHWLRFLKSDPAGEGREDILLLDAPSLSLKDALSGRMDYFTVQPGNYMWTHEENGEMQSVIACGAHPLDDADLVHTPVLELPRYHKMDFVSYFFSSVIAADRVTVRKWDGSALGNPDAPEAEVTFLEKGESLLDLEPGCVYELTLEWKEENFAENGFYGNASYAFVTQ